MSLSKKHYIAVAAIIAERIAYSETIPHHIARGSTRATAVSIAELLADYFAGDNVRFDRERFLKAAGVRS